MRRADRDVDIAQRAGRREKAAAACGAVRDGGRAAAFDYWFSGAGRRVFVAETEAGTLGTSYLRPNQGGGGGHVANAGYATSKLAAEQVVRDSGVPAVVLRPSVVIGDSRTGEISAFQGLHGVAGAILTGTVPMVPFDPPTFTPDLSARLVPASVDPLTGPDE